ncbi:Gamma-interferon-inducible lysosomal thiol reductase, partial [Trichinella patagoniensis]
MIYCTEYLLKANNSSGREVWRECAQNLHYPQEPIQKCYESGLGKQLELAYGKETSDLHPPHDFTPWVVVNGQPLREHYMDYISYICKAYKGKNPPK